MFLNSIVSTFAPFYCLGCSRRGYLLCEACYEGLNQAYSRCYRCHKSTIQSQTCKSCRSTSPLAHFWVAAEYDGLPKEVVERLKFERAASASMDIARILSELLPLIPEDTVVTYVPTANSRVRQRGYDQSKLIAKSLASMRNLKFEVAFSRIGNARQVGSSRDQRFEQAKSSYGLIPKQNIVDKRYIIIDDVTTSGATLEATATLLKKAGAKSVDGLVFAQAVE